VIIGCSDMCIRVLSYLLASIFGVRSIIADPVAVTGSVVGNGMILGTDTFESGIRVSLRAVPQVDWRFDHWEGVENGVVNQRVIELNADSDVKPVAVFKPAIGMGRFKGGAVIGGPTNLQDIVAIAAGEAHGLALRSNGVVVSWGNTPGQLTSWKNVVAIAAGDSNSLGLTADGSILWDARLWGGPAVLSDVFAIAAGRQHHMVLQKNGTILRWGPGQPAQPAIVGASNIVGIAAGDGWDMVLREDGNVLGNEGSGWLSPPKGLTNIISIAAGGKNGLALRSDGTVVAWGILGALSPAPPNGLNDVIAVSAGEYHSLALKSDGTVIEWGEKTMPTGLTGVVAVSAGRSQSLALVSDHFSIIKSPPAQGLIEEGSQILLKAQAAKATSYQWYCNGRPIPGMTSPWLRIPKSLRSDSGQYQLLASNGNDDLLTTPCVVKVLAAGSPRVSVNGIQTISEARVGESAQVALTTSFPNGQIFYSLDGSEPGLNSYFYTGVFTITNSAVIRAYAISDDFTRESVNDPISIQIVPKCLLKIESIGGGYVEFRSDPVLYFSGESDAVNMPYIQINNDAGLNIKAPLRAGSLGGLVGSIKSPGQILFQGASWMVSVVTSAGNFVQGWGGQGWLVEKPDLAQPFLHVSFDPALARINNSAPGGKSGGARIIGRPRPSESSYLQDDVVTLIANPDEGFRFIGWEGDLFGSFSERNIVMNHGKAVRAVFEAIPRHQLIAAASAGTVSGAGEYYQGSRVDLNATPATNWTFLNWSGDYTGSNPQFSWVVDGPAKFQAVFGTAITSATTGSGRVMLEPDLPVYPYGSLVKITPLPNPGNYLALWGGAGVGQPRTQWIFRVTNGAPKITALFQPLSIDKVVLTAQSTFGGRISQQASDGIYAKGASVSVSAVPDSGYEFLGWSGDAGGVVNPLTLTLDASKNVRAEFRRTGVVSYPATITVNGPGTVRRVPDLGEYESGTEVDFVAEPSAGAVFSGWQGLVSSSQKRIRVTMNGPIQMTAGFKSVYPVATEARGEGQILLSPPDANYVEGTSVALTAKPAEGWGFVQWSGDLGTTAQESALTVDAPKRVVAEFARLGTLTLKNIGQGTVFKVPEGSLFLPGTSVRLNATPAPGWKFIRWSGGATGTNPELAVVVGRTEAIVAEFVDGEAPRVTLTEPVSGNVREERFALKGSASDNLRLASVSWTWNGVPQGAVPMGDGVFSIEGLTLQPGTNQIALDAVDAVGNATRVERMVVWTPVRSLLVKTAPEVQEGQRLVFPVTLDSPGDVAGLTFQLSYDPVWLADLQWEWGALVGQSVNTLNTATNGQIWATFSMPGQTLPPGVQSIANVSFRARSVPEVRVVDLKPSIRSVSGLQGDALSPGNAALAGQGRIKSRRIKADNNANQRLDIGDAVVVARLQVGLDEARAWDVTLNDLNDSGSLDNGDVVKVLRAVVGLDAQPGPGSEGKRFAAALGLAKTLVNTNDAIALELIDGPTAAIGQPYRVAVRLNRVEGSLSGLSFTLKYPASLSLTDKLVGGLVPGDALPFWNESAGQVSLAAIRSTAWASATGVAAVLTFVPSAAFSGQGEWPLKLEQAEITGSGFDVRPVDSVTVSIQTGGGTVDNRPQLTLQPPKADGSLGLEIRAPQGATVAVETTSDLSAWTETQRITGQGDSTPVKVTLQADPNVQTKFWRVRVR
jgi:hypothetical protein